MSLPLCFGQKLIFPATLIYSVSTPFSVPQQPLPAEPWILAPVHIQWALSWGLVRGPRGDFQGCPTDSSHILHLHFSPSPLGLQVAEPVRKGLLTELRWSWDNLWLLRPRMPSCTPYRPVLPNVWTQLFSTIYPVSQFPVYSGWPSAIPVNLWELEEEAPGDSLIVFESWVWIVPEASRKYSKPLNSVKVLVTQLCPTLWVHGL